MMTVKEASKLTGVSVRTLQYYDSVGLLKPTAYTESGYRLYDDTALERLQQILLFKELEFSLSEIKFISDAPDFDREKALRQQINLLELKKEHLDNLIAFARTINTIGVRKMDFSAFDTKKIDEYAKKAKEQWGNTSEYREFEERSKDITDVQKKDINSRFMLIFAEFGKLKGNSAEGEQVQEQVKALQRFIFEHYYECSKEFLSGLGQMYVADGEFMKSIDSCGGEGTAEFVSKAIDYYCRS